MKKIYLLFSFLIVSFIAISQQVPRNWVLVEIATGTWCTYCPGAALGADDLIANGHPAAIIENHNGDTFTTDDSDARNGYYGISSYPTAQFDGSYDSYPGGSHTQSMYNNYYPIVDNRINTDSDFTLEIFGTNSGDDYSINVRLQDVGGYSGDNLALRFALTESEIEYTWQDQDMLNFVNRLMLPDHNGVDLSSYDLTELTTIDLPFTFDNSWDDQHCEIVIFVQDDDSKEVLQSQKVGLPDLESMLAANFTASTTITCSGSSIDFTDTSAGEGISTWDWSFEGGTPSTSSDQNPTVSYATTGVFDVELTVTDAYGSSTTTQSDYISIFETPATAATPTGEDVICSGFDYYYSTDELLYAQEYEWEISPESAGNLIVSDYEATLEAADDWTGDFTIRVRATNLCGDGDWSDYFSGTMYQSAEVFSIEGGGGYCIEGDGVEITLSGSESGIEYELYFDDVPTGNIVSGTGFEISFGLLTGEGFYTVIGYTDYCISIMMEQVEVFHMFPPLEPGTPAGPDAICDDESSEYSSSGSDDADSYEWIFSPEEAGTLTANELDATVVWNTDFSGIASISLYGINECGEGYPSETLEVSVEAVPVPAIDGADMVCDFDVTDYSTPENEGCIYTWEVTGGIIVDGQGTYMVTIEWGQAGTGYLNVAEETANGCIGNANELEVMIDECTGMGENNLNVQVNVSPNPAKDFVTFKSNDNISSITIYSLKGEIIGNHQLSDKQVRINLSGYNPGIYVARIITEKGSVSKRLVIQ